VDKLSCMASAYCQIHCQIRGSKGIEGDFSSKQISNLLFSLSSSSFSTRSLSTFQSYMSTMAPRRRGRTRMVQERRLMSSIVVPDCELARRLDFTPFNLRSSMQEAHSRQNAFFSWTAPDRHWRAQIFVRNIDGNDDLSHAFVASTIVGSPVIGSYQEPRTFGARLTYQY
jgi:hypothetical protein